MLLIFHEFTWVPTLESYVAIHEITATDGQVIHSRQTGLFIMCLRAQIHTKIPPLREWRNMVWRSKKSCTLTKMSYRRWEPLCAERGIWIIVSKINWERKKKKASFTWPESRADSPPSAYGFDNDRRGVFNKEKEARQCSDIQMSSSVNTSVHITVCVGECMCVGLCVCVHKGRRVCVCVCLWGDIDVHPQECGKVDEREAISQSRNHKHLLSEASTAPLRVHQDKQATSHDNEVFHRVKHWSNLKHYLSSFPSNSQKNFFF